MHSAMNQSFCCNSYRNCVLCVVRAIFLLFSGRRWPARNVNGLHTVHGDEQRPAGSAEHVFVASSRREARSRSERRGSGARREQNTSLFSLFDFVRVRNKPRPSSAQPSSAAAALAPVVSLARRASPNAAARSLQPISPHFPTGRSAPSPMETRQFVS